MKINEIFHSIQGEGFDAGRPTIFIRLTGCNLRCSYCDTTYAFYEGKEMEIEEIMEEIKKWRCRRVCITGGEPLLQEDVYSLIDSLLEKGYDVSVETNGSIDIRKLVERNVTIKMDYKLPSSGMNEKMLEENIHWLREKDEIKFVIGNREDYEYALGIMKRYSPKCHIVVQPVWNKMDVKKVAQWILDDGIDAILSLQIHKIIWGEERGK